MPSPNRLARTLSSAGVVMLLGGATALMGSPAHAVSQSFTVLDTQIGVERHAAWTTAVPDRVSVIEDATRGAVLQLRAGAGESTALTHYVSSGAFEPLDGYLSETNPLNLFSGASGSPAVPASEPLTFDVRAAAGDVNVFFEFTWRYSDTQSTTDDVVVSCNLNDEFELGGGWTVVDWYSGSRIGVCERFTPHEDVTVVGPWGHSAEYRAGQSYPGLPTGGPFLDFAAPQVSTVDSVGLRIVNNGDGPAAVDIDALTVRGVLLDFAAGPRPGVPPVADAAALDQLIAERGLDVNATTKAFRPQHGSAGALNPAIPLTATLPWSSADDAVDIYAYSSPVFLGGAPVINGQVVMTDVDLSALPEGEHRLVFVGQSSGTVSVVAMTLVSETGGPDTPGGGEEPVSPPAPELAETGTDGAIAALGAVFLLAGIVLIASRRLTTTPTPVRSPNRR